MHQPLGHRVVRTSISSESYILTAKSHQKYRSTLSYSSNLRMSGQDILFLLSSSARTQYYAQFQHSHYPQASYGHYQPYIPPAQTAQTQTPAPVTAAVQRQPAQAASQLDTADVATLNDAIGSAGVDLRVSVSPINPPFHRTDSQFRPKKKLYSAVPTNTKHIARMKTAHESNPLLPTLIPAS
jgi:hypothetical protein